MGQCEGTQQRERSEFNRAEQLYRGIESKAVSDSQGTSLSGSPDYPKESSHKVVLYKNRKSLCVTFSNQNVSF